MWATVLDETRALSVHLDPTILERLGETNAAVARRSLLVWAEHCTECVMPSCYSTCSLYTPRSDLKCRRFAQGIEPLVVPIDAGHSVPMMRVTFRRWGKLEAVGETRLASLRATRRLERIDRMIGALMDFPGLSYRVRRRATTVWSWLKSNLYRFAMTGRSPDFLLIEAVNMDDRSTGFTVTVKSTDTAATSLFQDNVDFVPGYNRLSIPTDAIFRSVDPRRNFLVQIEPVSSDSQSTVVFGIVDFVSLRPGVRFEQVPEKAPVVARRANDGAQRPKAKCIVWDLDNTIWRGTLVEDGPENLQLNAAAAATIVELDRRGILHSIASKNSREEAEPVLRRFGLWDYFLAPQINWDPKSSSIDAIAATLNIGNDTLLFVDDQIFERQEVQASHPEVEVFDIAEIGALISHPRLDVPITHEAQRRRLMYREEEARESALHGVSNSSSAFLTFLQGCDLKLRIDSLQPANLNRVFELTERTNQLNYAGGRVSRSDLDAVMARTHRQRGLVLSASDRFGDYGIIGFALVDPDKWSVENFFMSCRVQRKRVDHAFFGHVLALGAQLGKARLSVNYRKTKRNAPSLEVLEQQMMFRAGDERDGARVFYRESTETIPESDIVAVEDLGTAILSDSALAV